MLGSVRGVVSNDHSYRDKANPRVPTLFRTRKATRFGRTIARSERPGVVEEPGMCRSSLDGNREIPRLASCGAPLWPASGRRRSQKDGTTWRRITKLANDFLPRARILHPWPQERFAVRYPRWEPSARMGPARFCAGGAQ